MITRELAEELTEQLWEISAQSCGDHGPAVHKLCVILATIIGALDHA